MATPSKTRQWLLASQPRYLPKPERDFTISNARLHSLEDGQVLLQTKYLSNDPVQRQFMMKSKHPERGSMPFLELGDVVRSLGIAIVLESKSTRYIKGSSVLCWANWAEFSVQPEEAILAPVQSIGPLGTSHFLGAFGLGGWTAIHGLELENTTKDDVVLVSGAAGATGSMAVQVAKNMLGCKKVIGIAGTDDKCRWVESIGADVCVNYKSPSFEQDLAKATGRKANAFFDNVAGTILNLMLTHMACFGRIAVSGSIATYNKGGENNLTNWWEMIQTRLTMVSFVATDLGPKLPETTGRLINAYMEGKLKLSDDNETVVDSSFEGIPDVWMRLFSGESTGKLVTRIV